MIFSFDIETSTHDMMKDGIIAGRFFGAEANHQRVTVSADTWEEASMTAIQMGMCFGYVTSCNTRI